MKLFVYKTLFIFGCIFILFQLTFGVKIKEFKYELNEIKSRENIIYFKNIILLLCTILSELVDIKYRPAETVVPSSFVPSQSNIYIFLSFKLTFIVI